MRKKKADPRTLLLQSVRRWILDDIQAHVSFTCAHGTRENADRGVYDLSTMDEHSRPDYETLLRRLRRVERALEA